MKREQLFLILSILLILLLLFLTEFQKPVTSGKIEKITINYPTRIKIEDDPNDFIIFDREVNLKKDDEVKLYGLKQNKEEIIINKIRCLNC